MFSHSKLATAALGALGFAMLVFIGGAYDTGMGIICILIG